MRTRMAPFSGLVAAVVTMLAWTSRAEAQQVVKLADGETLTISGFISASFYTDNGVFASFGQGQDAEIAAAPAAQPGTKQSFTNGDIRNTRIRFEFASQPVFGKWAPKGVLEADFFGSFVGAGAPPFQDEQPQFRARLLYADMSDGPTTLRIGQFWAPLFAEVPVSVTHIAFPLGFGSAGMIGWRFPGVFLYHDLSRAGAPISTQLQVAVMKGSGPAVGAIDAANGIGTGEASGLPQLEARLNFGKSSGSMKWTAYVVGHLDWKDTTGNGGASTSNLSADAVEVGGSIVMGQLTVHGNFYDGKAIGQEFAFITQYGQTAGQGNIKGYGAWIQAGYDFTPHWSLWAFYGLDQPDYKTFATDEAPAVLPRQGSHDGDALVRWRAGRYAVGLEYFWNLTRYNTGVGRAGQLALSTQYIL
jgi:hypothetical protein